MMKIRLPKKKRLWIVLAITVPVICWSISEILPLIASALNRQGYQVVRREPSGLSGILTIRKKEALERKTVKDIRFPLTRTSDPRFDHDRFTLKLYGLLDVERAGFYWVGSESDDGSWIRLKGDKILDNGGLHSRETKMNLIHMDKGLQSIELRYENQMGEAYLDLFWVTPEGTRSPLPLLPNPWGRVSAGLLWTAFLFFKIAQYWVFFTLPLLLYPILFPVNKPNSNGSAA
ncbi:MAG: hypothetical protein AB1585_14480 [Thermodesulfobacteriota bacterium]